MNGLALLGIILVVYSFAVVGITVKKPPAIWNMAKIKFFIKLFGEKGTVIFFYVFAAIALAIGIWLLTI
ncbi:hypothetical protein [Alkalibacter saccharofermentans]|uniref:Immunity protein 17 n=1 Tax=Alkalibacter saccharofermentans DSM 14828 TaxID=1120975 RepID=A0A1M4SJI1_9FIRM|nr:hypothetical protein [Alkalibacter saccharofermentans]SHE32312.1 hypothetical protein SAMN02746064_00284 [Alkalibacter saccharofermentans DSM 14828]